MLDDYSKLPFLPGETLYREFFLLIWRRKALNKRKNSAHGVSALLNSSSALPGRAGSMHLIMLLRNSSLPLATFIAGP